ncbi:hypothetical protein BCIN_04g01800 [Botrytis cinerea B05.10]|uniref:Uncharacterized protein n=2 Tax=Botryotinia fuckeliana TaxID=40559 RepID=A0A384JEE2_BOTFB|nr:hypothetical protein BCIN_04g01800 [Botrytis cinerea B05.10]ATZ48973.1 hypothetical protein BCIN_04g01800 [Botrytis cinerea B05.10]CCD56728.1 hypothetical protein BofuT4_P145360.1 [Botrytis cinerea T4]
MEPNHTKSTINTPYVDPGLLMIIDYQIEAERPEEWYRDYRMREEHIDSMNIPITSSEARTVATIEGSEGETMPLETLSYMQEMPEVIPETRAETKKRRRQEFLDNYDAESYELVADNLLESQIRHYAVLRRCGMAPAQAKADTHNKMDTWSEKIESSEESDPTPRYGDFISNLHISQSSIKSKILKLTHGDNNMSAIGKSGPGVTKKGHVAKKRAIINKKDTFELMFKGMEHSSRT